MGWYRNRVICSIFCISLVLTAGCTTPSQQTGEYSYDTPYPVTIVSVTDGDTVHVMMPDGTEEVVRLLGVDTPEKSAEGNRPGEYGSIQDTSYLALWGEEAARYTTNILTGNRAEITFDRDAGIRDPYGRLLAYLTLEDKEDFNANLISNGYARAYSAETFMKRSMYQDLQNTAQKNKSGLWQYTENNKQPEPTGVYILDVIYDAAGDDMVNMNDEKIILANAQDSPTDLSQWHVKESDGAVYTFTEGIIPGHERIILHIGSGDDTMTDKYWNLDSPVLGNNRDTVVLFDNKGIVVSSFSW